MTKIFCNCNPFDLLPHIPGRDVIETLRRDTDFNKVLFINPSLDSR